MYIETSVLLTVLLLRQDSGATAKAELLKYGSSMASGHTQTFNVYKNRC